MTLATNHDTLATEGRRFARLAVSPRAVAVTAMVLLPVLAQAILVLERLIDWSVVWAWYPDPGYQYLLSSGSIVTGGTTDLIFHPGASFMWLIGLSEVTAHFVAGEGEFRSDVVLRPEFYAQVASCVLATVYVASLAFAAVRMMKALGPWSALIFQFLLLWSLPVLNSGRYVLWPESIVLTAAIAVLGLIAPQLAGTHPQRPWTQGVFLGLLGAIGITGKVTFIPVIVSAVLLLQRKQVLPCIGALTAASIVFLAPLGSRLGDMWQWFTTISSNPGRHGQTGDWSPLPSLQASLVAANGYVRWFLPVTVVVVLGAVALLFRARKDRSSQRPVVAILLGVALILAGGIKSTEVRDFLLVFPLLAALAAVVVRRVLATFRPPVHMVVAIGISFFSLFLAAHGVVGERYSRQAHESSMADRLASADEVDDLATEGIWAPGYNAWTKDSALVFGLIWSAGSFDAEVGKAVPNAAHYNVFDGRILHVSGDGRLASLTCREMVDAVSGPGLGIVVESNGHIHLDDTGSRVQLAGATARFQGPISVGQYFGYRLYDVRCSD